MTGHFITFEGGEGAGKSTQIELLARALQQAGEKVIRTREPGGTEKGETIRNLIVEGKPGDLTPMTEALLHSAARAEHIAKVIKPSLAQNYWVLCDRFVDSTLAYQGYGHGLDRTFLANLAHNVGQGLMPDLTFIFDIPVAQGLGRARVKQSYEALDGDFHERVRQGFHSIAKADPKRCRIIDANQPIKAIHLQILDCIADRFGFSLLR